MCMCKRERERETGREKEREAKEGGSGEIDSGRARRRRVVGSSRVTSGRAGAAPGSCGVCRRLGGCCCTSTRPFCVPIRPPSLPPAARSPTPLTRIRVSANTHPSLLPSRTLPRARPFFIVPYRHIGSFSNSISLNGIKTILLRVRLTRSLERESLVLAAVRFPDRSPLPPPPSSSARRI